MRHHQGLRRDIGQDELKDRAWLVMQQSDTPFQVKVLVDIAAQDPQLCANQVGSSR